MSAGGFVGRTSNCRMLTMPFWGMPPFGAAGGSAAEKAAVTLRSMLVKAVAFIVSTFHWNKALVCRVFGRSTEPDYTGSGVFWAFVFRGFG